MLQLVVGVFLVAFGAWTGRGHFALIVTGARAEGRVVGLREVRMQQSQRSGLVTTAEMPFVEFRVGGRTYRFQDWLAGKRGDGLRLSVPVLYDPERPTVAAIDRKVMNGTPWAAFAGVGAFLLEGERGAIVVQNDDVPEDQPRLYCIGVLRDDRDSVIRLTGAIRRSPLLVPRGRKQSPRRR